ncbi:uncharacterized protein [Halyomorpha halys]|uniref:uncharacterized protein n=1 Tax=Halyomorpha halys TaxID=286706 RepID=UPI0034D1B93D
MLHQIGLPTDERQNISISYMPKHDSAEVYGRLKLACGQIKKDCPEPELRAAALKIIYELNPIEQWLHIYTNGSTSGINKGAGAGVYSINFQLSFPVGAGCDNYDAEMQAISFVMEATIECDDNTVIFSYSRAIIQKLTTPGAAESPMEEKCRYMAAIMKKRGRVIALQWIPGHIGIDGNEQADKLAKLGCVENQPVLPLSYRTVKSFISSCCKDRTSARH